MSTFHHTALQYKQLAATGTKPGAKLLTRKKGGVFLNQNPSAARVQEKNTQMNVKSQIRLDGRRQAEGPGVKACLFWSH